MLARLLRPNWPKTKERHLTRFSRWGIVAPLDIKRKGDIWRRRSGILRDHG